MGMPQLQFISMIAGSHALTQHLFVEIATTSFLMIWLYVLVSLNFPAETAQLNGSPLVVSPATSPPWDPNIGRFQM